MEKEYSVNVNSSTTFNFSKAEIDSLDVREVSDGRQHILQNGKSTFAEIVQSDFLNKRYSVKINARVYEVAISNELDQLIKEMGLTAKVSKDIKDIKAPMPGLILDVNVTPGQEVKEGDYLLVLEAMKMENTLTAPKNGTVKAVVVKKGQTVDKNQVLVEME